MKYACVTLKKYRKDFLKKKKKSFYFQGSVTDMNLILSLNGEV